MTRKKGQGALGAPDGRGNRAFFRELNERIAGLQPSGMFIEFACECTNRDCAAPIALTVDEYEGVRRSPVRFAVRPGHQAPAVERLVELNARYAVVEKH